MSENRTAGNGNGMAFEIVEPHAGNGNAHNGVFKGLPEVAKFDAERFLPKNVAPWVIDQAERMQCPPDYLGVSIIVALATTLGCKICIRPMEFDDWTVAPNLWGLSIGPPGDKKSPAMEEATGFIKRLEAEAGRKFKADMRAYNELKELHEKKKKGTASKVAEGVELPPLGDPPTRKRYMSTDPTYEKLGMIMEENPSGMLVYCDEMVPHIQYLDRPENSKARAFTMTGWNGHSSTYCDRVSRPPVYIPQACLSMLGAATPNNILKYMASANASAYGGDGFVQRFSLGVWPDPLPKWENVKRWPRTEARDRAASVFDYLDKVTPKMAGCEEDAFKELHYLRFDTEAQAIFDVWIDNLENKTKRVEGITDAFLGHIAKYGKLVPAIALINHLTDNGNGPVKAEALRQAIDFVAYLETHARRIYSAHMIGEAEAAATLLDKINVGKLENGFTKRDVLRPQWSKLTNGSDVEAALTELCELGYLSARDHKDARGKGGRPTVQYFITPRHAPQGDGSTET